MLALPRKMVQKIFANDYIDFSELHSAKGKIRTSQSLKGQVILIQAEDLMLSKKDLSTCYNAIPYT